MKIVLVIPARYKSTRLPGKPLIDIEGKLMIRRVYEQCIKAIPSEDVYIATDDDRILNHCEEWNMNVVKTSENCLTGTDRVAEFSQKIDADYYINVQGDEPLMNPNDIIKIKNEIESNKGKILNGYTAITNKDDFFSVGFPKVVFRNDNRLLYMSRAGIPLNKSNTFNLGFRQVCVYAFPKKALIDFSNCKAKTRFEEIEDIEILRFLEIGYDVQMIELSSESIPVDYPDDLLKVKKVIRNQ